MRNSMSNNEKIFMENTMNRVFDLIKKSGRKEYPLELEIGLSRSAIQNWRLNKSKAGTYSLTKIANYFNVSLDYLVGRETPINNTNIENKATSDPLLNKIAQLDELQRAKVEAYVDGLQTTTKELFNQGRLIAREKQIAEENIKEKKQI